MKTLIRILFLSVLWFSCEEQNKDVHGCLDSQACNYNPNANIDNNSCLYILDCNDECGGDNVDEDEDGICDDIDDCVGEYDCAGICEGDNKCYGCTNVDACNFDPNANIFDDSCVYDSDNDGYCDDIDDCYGEGIDEDEDNICDGIDPCVGLYDSCGICNGSGIIDGSCDCEGNIEDCMGQCGGNLVIDNCGVCGGDNICDKHLIMKKVCVLPNECEIIEIYNPTNEEIDLSNYYLSDQKDYFNWVNDQTLSLSIQDFIFKFPDGSSISSHGTYTITTNSISDFNLYYGYNPDVSLIDTQLDLSFVGSNANLSNSQEVLILFYWDESSYLVQDVDYFLWGGDNQAIYKTVDDGYPFDDTPLLEQKFIRNYSSSLFSDSTYVRLNTQEINENIYNGNGITDHDETSEHLNLTWKVQHNEKSSMSFDNIINGDYDCDSGGSSQACSFNLDCPFVTVEGTVVDYFDITQFGGPHAITIEDENGFKIDLTIWPDNWDIANDPDPIYSDLLNAPFGRYYVKALGRVFEYDGRKQIYICSSENLEII